MSNGNLIKARLVRSAPLTPDTVHYVFEAPAFEFTAGQYTCLEKHIGGERHRAYYSIASAPANGNRFELCVNSARDDSPMGRFLHGMKPGAEVECQAPAGGFRLKAPVRESIFLANGAGIAPIRSMLQSLLTGGDLGDSRPAVPLTLLFGARAADWLMFRQEFEQWETSRANFRFRPVLSRPADDWTGRRGYVQEHLDQALSGRSEGVDVYLCGRPAMVKDVRERLAQQGFDETSVVYEKYG